MPASISINWHIHTDRCAEAIECSYNTGLLRIHGGDKDRYPDLNIFFPDDQLRHRLAAAAINGELGDLLEDLYELCDDLGDGAPDSPPYAHRALNLAARLDAVLPKPVKVPA